ncbi:MAG TPA: hypothetical protein VN329_00680 [Roseomonas sp.]|nr:hypothetical protein [Roseomonas sp.]
MPMVAHAGITALLGDDSALAFIAFLVLLAPGALCAWVVLGPGGIVLPLAGMMAMILLPLSVVFLPEIRPFGRMPVREATSGRTTPYLPRGAEPRPEFERAVSVSQQSMHRPMRGVSAYPVTLRGRYTVVPLLPPGWTPSQPVHAVAMVDLPDRGEAPRPDWPAQGGLVPLRDSDLRVEAARQALAMAGLQPAPALAIGRWSDSPWRTRIDELAPVLLAYAGGVAAWAAMVLLARMRRA